MDVLRPQIREALHISLTQAGSAYTAQGLGALTGAIVLGQLADVVGRRRMVFTVVLGYGVFAAAGALVTSYPLLLLQRLALGFFLGGNLPRDHSRPTSACSGRVSGASSRRWATATTTWPSSRWAPRCRWAWMQADWRHVLLVGAIPPLFLAPLLLIVPDDRRLIPWGGADPAARGKGLPVMELFRDGLARRTAAAVPDDRPQLLRPTRPSPAG